MINRLLNELELELSKKYKYISQRMLNEELIDLFFLKYYCDNNILTYEETIKAENVRELNIPNDIFEIKHRIIYSNKLVKYDNPLKASKATIAGGMFIANIVSNRDDQKAAEEIFRRKAAAGNY